MLLKQRARERGVPSKEAVNRMIRTGLGEAAKPRRGGAPKTSPHSFGFRPGVDLDKLGQLADELEAEAFAVSSEKSPAYVVYSTDTDFARFAGLRWVNPCRT